MARVTPTPYLTGATAGSWTGTSITVTTPATPAGGWKTTDCIVVVYRGNVQGANPAANANFTRRAEAHTNSADARTRGIYAHMVTSGEVSGGVASTFSFTGASGTQTRGSWVAFVLRDVDPTSPGVGDSTTGSNPSGTTVRTSISNVTAIPALLISAFGNEVTSPNSSIPTTIPSGFTVIANNNNLLDVNSTTGTRTTLWVGYKAASATGATGNIDLTWASLSGNWTATAAFYGADVPGQGSASGSYNFADGSVTGKRVPKGTASGSYEFSGTAVGKRTPKGSASGSYAFAASSATGDAPDAPSIPAGTASGSYAFAASGIMGKRTPKGSGSGGYDFAGTATGKRTPKGTASGSYSFTGTATGNAKPKGTASGSYAFAGSNATGKRVPKGSGSGGFAFAASGITGKRTPKGSGSGGYAFAGTAVGEKPEVPGFPSVAAVLAQLGGATMGHRDLGVPDACQVAYQQMVDLGHGILEFSCGFTSDNVPFALGQQYLDTQSQITGNVDPKTMTWAYLSSHYQITLNAGGNPQPYYKLEDAVQDFPNHVFAVDFKYGILDISRYANAMMDILDDYGGPNRFIIKFDSPGATAYADLARSRGYKTMNYWGTDTSAMASEQSHWDIIGARFDNSTAMAQANTYGKPVWAFPIDSQANYTTAISNGADLVMVRSSSVAVVPWAGIPAGEATGSYTFAGTAVGKRTPKGSASGGYAFAGTSTGKRTPKGSCSGDYVFSGTASGFSPIVGGKFGQGSGGYNFAGVAIGKRTPKAAITSSYDFAGIAVGSKAQGGTASGAYTFATTSVTGKKVTQGSASGGYAFSGTAVGSAPPIGGDQPFRLGDDIVVLKLGDVSFHMEVGDG